MSDETPILLPPAEDHSDRPKWRHWTWWLHPKVALPLMLSVLLLLSPFLVRGWHLAKVPDIADPFDVEAFLSETVDDKDNAFVDYHAAAALLVPSTFSHEEFDAGWEKASSPLRLWVDANRPALDRWRLGTEKFDAINGDLRRSDSLQSLPDFAQSREFLRLACLQGEREQSEGHMSEAWQWYRSLMRFSRHVGQRTGSLGRFLGYYLHSETAKRIVRWAEDSQVGDDDLQVALDQLTADFQLTRPFSELLKVHYCDLWKLAWAREEWNRNPLFVIGDEPSWRDSRFVRYCFGQPDFNIRWNKLVLENWLAGGDTPRRSQRRMTSKHGGLLDVTSPGSGISGSELRRLLDASALDHEHRFKIGESRDQCDKEFVRHEALRLILACQLWGRRRGTFPDNLEDITPGILAELPVDPFSQTGEGFRYRRDGEDAVVESTALEEIYDPGVEHSRWREINYRMKLPRNHDKRSEQKPVDEP
ncbi:MAG: hypothetical protein IAG10_34495 [Planctomycetaceae bacterium]|nr:hypothetical protein [Planctomycetaceae bacterium]